MSVEYKDYYKILGVSKNSNAGEIKKAYRKLAKKYHPDVNKSPEGETKYRDINEAYEVLKDPEKKRMYDELGPNWQNAQGFNGGFNGGFNQGGGQRVNMDFGGDMGGFSDFFRTIFGGGMGGMNMGGMGSDDMFFGQRGPSRGQDQEVALELPLEDLIKTPLKRRISLAESNGSSRSIEVNLPRGITDGSKLKLRGQGAPGMGGGPRGDLNVVIRLRKNPHFDVDRHDLSTIVKVAPWEAALGMDALEVTTLEGSLKMKLPAGTQGGQRLRLKGKGLPLRGSGNGDLYVKVEVAIPKSLSERERELFHKLSEESTFKAR